MAANEFFQSLWAWFYGFLQQLLPVYVLPNLQLIIQVVVLLIVAYVVGKVGKLIVTRFLSVVGLKRITSRTWAESVLKVTGYRGTIVELIGDLVKWLIYILFLAVIIQTAGLPGIADIFTQIAVFMPRFIAAILLIVVGFIIADFFGRVFEEAGRSFLGEEMLSRLTGGIVRYSIALIIIIMSLSMLGLDTASLLLMFAALLAAIIIVLTFGMRDILPNFTAGIQVRKGLKVGERVKFGNYSGVVERLEAQHVVLKVGKRSVSIPNALLLKEPMERVGKK